MLRLASFTGKLQWNDTSRRNKILTGHRSGFGQYSQTHRGQSATGYPRDQQASYHQRKMGLFESRLVRPPCSFILKRRDDNQGRTGTMFLHNRLNNPWETDIDLRRLSHPLGHSQSQTCCQHKVLVPRACHIAFGVLPHCCGASAMIEEKEKRRVAKFYCWTDTFELPAWPSRTNFPSLFANAWVR